MEEYFIYIMVNTKLRKHKVGRELKIKADKYGNPLDPYWRRRINDSEKDNCVSIINK